MTMQYQIISPVADIYGVPDVNAKRGKFETQLVHGEIFNVTEEKDGWCKGTCAHDGYPGYVQSIHLTKHVVSPTHIVTAGRSHTYRAPSIKSPLWFPLPAPAGEGGTHCAAMGGRGNGTAFSSIPSPQPSPAGAGRGGITLSFGSLIRLTGKEDGFVQINGGGWIYEKHVAPVDTVEKDYIATARKFLETPYYWGGRSGFGIDCSGLVQVSLARAGIAVPRDTDEQENFPLTPGEEGAHAQRGKVRDCTTGAVYNFTRSAIPHPNLLPEGEGINTLQAGDIVFFKGHVGLMADDRHLLHANATHMKTVIEPLADVVGRGNKVTSVRRV